MRHRFLWQKLFEVLREGEGGGGSGGSGGGDGGQGSAMLAPGATGSIEPAGGDAKPGSGGSGGAPDPHRGVPQDAGNQSAWKLPDGLPDQFKAAKSADDFANLVYTDWQRQRDDIAKRPAVPKDASEYKFEPSEKVKPFVGDLDKDPVFGFAREAALKAGVPAAQFQELVGGLYEAMAEKGMLPKPYDASAERRAFLGDEARGMSDEQMVEKVTPVVNASLDFLKGLKSTGVLDDASFKEFIPLLHSAPGLRAIGKLAKEMKAPGLSPGGNGNAEGITHTDLKARQRDPKNDPTSNQYDKAFREQTDALYRKMFG